MIRIKAPGRICLFGEHQDYLNYPVIAMAISKYIYLEAKKNSETKFIMLKLPRQFQLAHIISISIVIHMIHNLATVERGQAELGLGLFCFGLKLFHLGNRHSGKNDHTGDGKDHHDSQDVEENGPLTFSLNWIF